jgi:hypothetical protein
MQNRQIIAAGLGSALALIVCAGLKVSATPVTSAAAMSAFSASESVPQRSNRVLKGDRSPLVQAPVSDRSITSVPRDIVVIPELLDGCEAVISSIGNSPLAQVAGSCVS